VQFPRRVELAHLPTPMRHLQRLSVELGGPQIWVKRDDLTGSGLGGNKVRKLEFSIAEALDVGADTLITCGGLQSNHCRATAIAGAQLGFKVHLVLRGLPTGTPDGNLFLDHLLGAEVNCYPPEFYRARLDDIFQGLVDDYASQGRKAHIIPLGASDATGMWGYIGAAQEIRADCEEVGIAPDHIVCATGSGGTQGGLIVGNEMCGLRANVWGINVCDDDAHFEKKIRGDLHAWRKKYEQRIDVDSLPINMIDGHVGPGYAQSTPEILESIARIAQTEGLILDPTYTGKAFHGLMKEISQGRFRRDENLVFVHTGGIFGLFAQRSTFPFREVRDSVF
jgi:D-cysteine desulfhydrase